VHAQAATEITFNYPVAVGGPITRIIDGYCADFERQNAAALATDVDGNPVFLATSKYNLQVTMEHWPRVQFDATREHGRTMAQG